MKTMKIVAITYLIVTSIEIISSNHTTLPGSYVNTLDVFEMIAILALFTITGYLAGREDSKKKIN